MPSRRPNGTIRRQGRWDAPLSCLPVARAVATAAELEGALERLYGSGWGSLEQIAATAEATEEESTEADVARLRDQASEAPVIRIVNLLIAKAAEARGAVTAQHYSYAIPPVSQCVAGLPLCIS